MPLNLHRLAGIVALVTAPLGAASISPVPEAKPPVVSDRQDFQTPDRIQLDGWLGQRMAESRSNRLLRLAPSRLLEGFQHRPGRQAWDGEYVGKWLHAATLAWVYSGDPALRRRLDEVAAGLIACQESDGYLGTYLPAKRWGSWDVWVHKYDLIGLITYLRYTGNRTALPACEAIGDLLCRTFGDESGKRDIIAAGEHAGLAPTSVLEPMALLYRLTGKRNYLDFCQYLIRSWDHPNGPHLLSRLLNHQGVNKVGDAKAYEMLSCINGVLELYRTTGDASLLQAALNAWQDIVAKRLYLTGTASASERFLADFDLPNSGDVAETCVGVTWLQINAQLLHLTGEARYADQLETTVYNQLLGAQRLDGANWGYYVEMEGRKPYGPSPDNDPFDHLTCCASSGPRGLALIPTFAISTDADGVIVNFYEPGSAHLTLHNHLAVRLNTATLYPRSGQIRLSVSPAKPAAFAVKLRIPGWCRQWEAAVNGRREAATRMPDGYVAIQRTWTDGDQIGLRLAFAPEAIAGDRGNQGKLAFRSGPLILAADDALIGRPDETVFTLALPSADPAELGLVPEVATGKFKTWPGALLYRINTVTGPIRLVPMADAGGTQSRYRIWLPLATLPRDVLFGGAESRSRAGQWSGAINDGDRDNPVATNDGQRRASDWFAIELKQPVLVRRVIFVHGHSRRNGGWFDTTGGKPEIQVRASPSGEWTTVGRLDSYPTTSATNDGGLRAGQPFRFELGAAQPVYGVRVIGTPASGNQPRQSYASCSELEAFGG